jgi:hypothetical protein
VLARQYAGAQFVQRKIVLLRAAARALEASAVAQRALGQARQRGADGEFAQRELFY